MAKKNASGIIAMCERDSLKEGLSVVIRALATKTMMPVLEGVQIEAVKGDQSDAGLLRLTCTDMSLGITTIVPAIVGTAGRVLLPGKTFSDYVSKAPSGQIKITEDEGFVQLTTQTNRTKMAVIDGEEFPALPTADHPTMVQLSGVGFMRLVQNTAFAAAVDLSRPVLSGIHFDVGAGLCKAAALDGYRLSYCAEQYDGDAEAVSCTVPASSCRHLAALAKPDDVVIMEVGKTYMAATIGGTRAVVRLLAGEFVAYDRIIPDTWLTKVRLSKDELSRALDRVSIMSSGPQGQYVTLHVGDDEVSLHTSSNTGEAMEQITAQREGRNIDIAFNSRFIKDFVKNFEGDIFWLTLNTPNNCGLLRPDREPDSACHMVLPVRRAETVG